MDPEEKELIFPWIKEVQRELLKSYPDVNDETIYLLHDYIHEEFEKLDWKEEKRTEAFYDTLRYFYLHFSWKKNFSEKPTLRSSCVQILYYMSYAGLILSRANIESEWLDRIIIALKFFPGDHYLICDVMLLIKNVQHKYLPAYAKLLKSILHDANMNDPFDAQSFIKIMLLFRRLKCLLKTDSKEIDIFDLILKVKCPPDLRDFILSLNINSLTKISKKNFAQQFMKTKLEKNVLTELLKILFKKKYDQRIIDFSTFKSCSENKTNVSLSHKKKCSDAKVKMKHKIKQNIADKKYLKKQLLKKTKNKKVREQAQMEKEPNFSHESFSKEQYEDSLTVCDNMLEQYHVATHDDLQYKQTICTQIDNQFSDISKRHKKKVFKSSKHSALRKCKSKEKMLLQSTNSSIHTSVTDSSLFSPKNKKRKITNEIISEKEESSSKVSPVSTKRFAESPFEDGLSVSPNNKHDICNNAINGEIGLSPPKSFVLKSKQNVCASEKAIDEKTTEKCTAVISSPTFNDRSLVAGNLHDHTDATKEKNKNFLIINNQCASPTKILNISSHYRQIHSTETNRTETCDSHSDCNEENTNSTQLAFSTVTPSKSPCSVVASELKYSSPESLDLSEPSFVSMSSKIDILERSKSIYTTSDSSIISSPEKIPNFVEPFMKDKIRSVSKNLPSESSSDSCNEQNVLKCISHKTLNPSSPASGKDSLHSSLNSESRVSDQSQIADLNPPQLSSNSSITNNFISKHSANSSKREEKCKTLKKCKIFTKLNGSMSSNKNPVIFTRKVSRKKQLSKEFISESSSDSDEKDISKHETPKILNSSKHTITGAPILSSLKMQSETTHQSEAMKFNSLPLLLHSSPVNNVISEGSSQTSNSNQGGKKSKKLQKQRVSTEPNSNVSSDETNINSTKTILKRQRIFKASASKSDRDSNDELKGSTCKNHKVLNEPHVTIDVSDDSSLKSQSKVTHQLETMNFNSSGLISNSSPVVSKNSNQSVNMGKKERKCKRVKNYKCDVSDSSSNLSSEEVSSNKFKHEGVNDSDQNCIYFNLPLKNSKSTKYKKNHSTTQKKSRKIMSESSTHSCDEQNERPKPLDNSNSKIKNSRNLYSKSVSDSSGKQTDLQLKSPKALNHLSHAVDKEVPVINKEIRIILHDILSDENSSVKSFPLNQFNGQSVNSTFHPTSLDSATVNNSICSSKNSSLEEPSGKQKGKKCVLESGDAKTDDTCVKNLFDDSAENKCRNTKLTLQGLSSSTQKRSKRYPTESESSILDNSYENNQSGDILQLSPSELNSGSSINSSKNTTPKSNTSSKIKSKNCSFESDATFQNADPKSFILYSASEDDPDNASYSSENASDFRDSESGDFIVPDNYVSDDQSDVDDSEKDVNVSKTNSVSSSRNSSSPQLKRKSLWKSKSRKILSDSESDSPVNKIFSNNTEQVFPNINTSEINSDNSKYTSKQAFTKSKKKNYISDSDSDISCDHIAPNNAEQCKNSSDVTKVPESQSENYLEEQFSASGNDPLVSGKLKSKQLILQYNTSVSDCPIISDMSKEKLNSSNRSNLRYSSKPSKCKLRKKSFSKLKESVSESDKGVSHNHSSTITTPHAVADVLVSRYFDDPSTETHSDCLIKCPSVSEDNSNNLQTSCPVLRLKSNAFSNQNPCNTEGILATHISKKCSTPKKSSKSNMCSLIVSDTNSDGPTLQNLESVSSICDKYTSKNKVKLSINSDDSANVLTERLNSQKNSDCGKSAFDNQSRNKIKIQEKFVKESSPGSTTDSSDDRSLSEVKTRYSSSHIPIISNSKDSDINSNLEQSLSRSYDGSFMSPGSTTDSSDDLPLSEVKKKIRSSHIPVLSNCNVTDINSNLGQSLSTNFDVSFQNEKKDLVSSETISFSDISENAKNNINNQKHFQTLSLNFKEGEYCHNEKSSDDLNKSMSNLSNSSEIATFDNTEKISQEKCLLQPVNKLNQNHSLLDSNENTSILSPSKKSQNLSKISSLNKLTHKESNLDLGNNLSDMICEIGQSISFDVSFMTPESTTELSGDLLLSEIKKKISSSHIPILSNSKVSDINSLEQSLSTSYNVSFQTKKKDLDTSETLSLSDIRENAKSNSNNETNLQTPSVSLEEGEGEDCHNENSIEDLNKTMCNLSHSSEVASFDNSERKSQEKCSLELVNGFSQNHSLPESKEDASILSISEKTQNLSKMSSLNELPHNGPILGLGNNLSDVAIYEKEKENSVENFPIDVCDERLILSVIDKLQNNTNLFDSDHLKSTFVNYFTDSSNEHNLIHKHACDVECEKSPLFHGNHNPCALETNISSVISHDDLVTEADKHMSHVTHRLLNTDIRINKVKESLAKISKEIGFNICNSQFFKWVQEMNNEACTRNCDGRCLVETRSDHVMSLTDDLNLDASLELFNSQELKNSKETLDISQHSNSNMTLDEQLNQMGYKMIPGTNMTENLHSEIILNADNLTESQNSAHLSDKVNCQKLFSVQGGRSVLSSSPFKTNEKNLFLYDVEEKSYEVHVLPEASPLRFLNESDSVTDIVSQSLNTCDNSEELHKGNTNIIKVRKKLNETVPSKYILINGVKFSVASLSPAVNLGRRCDDMEVNLGRRCDDVEVNLGRRCDDIKSSRIQTKSKEFPGEVCKENYQFKEKEKSLSTFYRKGEKLTKETGEQPKKNDVNKNNNSKVAIQSARIATDIQQQKTLGYSLRSGRKRR